jgi:hypothetical protein
MKYATIVPCVILSTLLGAQDSKAPEGRFPAPDRVHQAALSDVLGMTVRLQPNPEASAEATSNGRLAKHPTGSIADLVLAADGGESQWAAVSIGGMLGIGDRIVAVPRTALVRVITEGDPVFELRATEAELKALPEFNPKTNDGESLSSVLLASKKAWTGVRPDWRAMPIDASSPKKVDAAGDKTVDASSRKVQDAKTAVPVAFLLASQLMGCKVKSSDDKDFGSVDQGCYNLKTNCVDFFIIGQGGLAGIGETDYLVPFQAGRMTFVGEDKDAVMTLARSAAALKNAPEYVKPDHGVVSEQNARQACEFYGVNYQTMTVGAAVGTTSPETKN